MTLRLDLVLLPELGDILEDQDDARRRRSSSRMGTASGRKKRSSPSTNCWIDLCVPRGRPGGPAGGPRGKGRSSSRTAGRRPRSPASARRRVLADSVATSTFPSGSMTATASGRLSKACCVARWMRRSLAWSVRRNSRRLAAMALNDFGQMADLVPGIAGDDEVEIAAPDLVRGPDQALDRAEDPLRVKRMNSDGQRPSRRTRRTYICRRADRGALAGPVVRVAHVLLVHLEDIVRRGLDLTEQREEAREIGFMAERRRLGRVLDLIQQPRRTGRKGP